MSNGPPSPQLKERSALSIRDCAWLAIYSLRAFCELARARWRLRKIGPREIQNGNWDAGQAASVQSAPCDKDLKLSIEHISFVVPRIAAYLPWRADCLVQAIAAQNWLLSENISSEIIVGVRNSQHDGFNAHAWLRCGNAVIIGGDVSGYETLLESNLSTTTKSE